MNARHVFYRLISSNRIKEKHWFWKGKQVDIYDAIGRTLKWMRIDEMIPWSAITDEHRIVTEKIGFSDMDEFIDSELDNFMSGYGRCLAKKQEYYLEVWIEKATLLHIVKPIADAFCRRVVVCKGYNSVTFQAAFYKRASEAIGYGQKPIVLYLGDWDPSGTNMIYAAIQTLQEELDLYGVEYYRVGINPEHFNMIPADPVPLKPGDSRSKRFIKNYGPTAYELDAFHPEQLQQLVKDAIIKFTDMEAYEENLRQETRDQDDIDFLKDKVIKFVNDFQG